MGASLEKTRASLSAKVGKGELRLLVVLLILFALIWGFVELADEVMEGETGKFDQSLLLLMRNANDLSDPLGPAWVEEMGRDLTALGGNIVLTLVVLAVMGYMLLSGRRQIAIIVLVAGLGSQGMNTWLKTSFDRPRPDLVPHQMAVYTASFPSGHTMSAASIYLTLGALLARLESRRRVKVYILTLATVLSLLVGLSRIYLGVHWPTDVLAGWVAGTGWALLCWLGAEWLYLRSLPNQSAVTAKNPSILND